MNGTITSEIVVSYSQCPRKAYLLLCTDKRGTVHEYVRILQEQKEANQKAYIQNLKQREHDVQPYSAESLNNGHNFLVDATLKAEGLEAECGILTRIEGESNADGYIYEPTTFVGTYRISKEQKMELFFVAHVLEQVQSNHPVSGRVIGVDGRCHRVKLEGCSKTLMPLLEPLQEWATDSSAEPAPLILSKHCAECRFRVTCKEQAEQEDNLSLLDSISTRKALQKYERKGIFTIKQLSYTFRPRKRKKRAKNPPPVIHKPELQALAIREGKIYLQELPGLSRQPVELFLDIESIPDQGFHYLIGVVVCDGDTHTYHPFWADTPEDGVGIWQQFLAKADEYPGAPIYHYGSYEPRAVATLARRYGTDAESLRARLVNVNSYIYGKVYFPVRSNGLKAIGDFIGAPWTSPDASGLQSLVWRYQWEEHHNGRYKQLLLTYNEEDCQAVKLLLDRLSNIKQSGNTMTDVDFADQPKQHTTEISSQIHDQFEAVLDFANSSYEGTKIDFRQTEKKHDNDKKQRGAPIGHKGHWRKVPKAKKIIRVPRRRKCPEHKGELLQTSGLTAECTIIDLVFTRSGVRKSITKYMGTKGYCQSCHRYYNPHAVDKYANQLFGHGFQAWVIYQRLYLRLPYRVITQVLEDQFNERISEGTVTNFMRYLADRYSATEGILTQRILSSPFIHVDETKINIQGTEQYVWVFTDGNHVIFQQTETREAATVHDILRRYDGILISDFYPGYDSVQCKQQKCWVHLIRDLNNDLWANPFDTEYEGFLSQVRNLIMPIMETVQKYGLRERNLHKFRRDVDRFYERVIDEQRYRSELVSRYQERFARYRDALFTFLEYDGMPWHNNMAERALRHLAIQGKISGCFFESLIHEYLLLLGIMQTCRFQDKSFLGFLLSREKDIDKFKG